jgi:opacity protein-like surface antigen
MRLSILLGGALAAAAAASVAFAAPVSSVSIHVSPKVQHKAEKKYGVRDLDYLQRDLQKSIEQKVGVDQSGDRLEVTIVDVQPNRPTFKQLGDTIGLSSRSISIGGATLEGVRISPDGRRTPVRYSRYDNDIVEAHLYGNTTWSTAQNAFDGFARRVAKD